MRLDISNRTLYRFDDVVRESQNEVRTCPTTDAHQHLIAYRLSVAPACRSLAFYDYWGTRVDAFGIREPHLSMEIVAEAAVETSDAAPVPGPCPFEALREPPIGDLHLEYLERTPHADWGAGVEEVGREALVAGDVTATVVAVHDLVRERLAYESGSTHIGIDVEAVLAEGRGVCQDFAHLSVAVCRSLGIPARYVSGYLFTSSDQTGEDAEGDVVEVATHAWFEAAVPGYGWFGMDPTNGRAIGRRHVKIGHGRDYDDVPPLRGSVSGSAGTEVEASVEIRRMDPAHQATVVQPPLTRPDMEYPGAAAQQQQQQQQ